MFGKTITMNKSQCEQYIFSSTSSQPSPHTSNYQIFNATMFFLSFTAISAIFIASFATAAPLEQSSNPTKRDAPVTVWLNGNSDCSNQIAVQNPDPYASAVCNAIPGTNGFYAGTNGQTCTLEYFVTASCITSLGTFEVGPNSTSSLEEIAESCAYNSIAPDCHGVPYALSYKLTC